MRPYCGARMDSGVVTAIVSLRPDRSMVCALIKLPGDFNCCHEADTHFFSLPDPRAVAFISTTHQTTSAKKTTNSPFTYTSKAYRTNRIENLANLFNQDQNMHLQTLQMRQACQLLCRRHQLQTPPGSTLLPCPCR